MRIAWAALAATVAAACGGSDGSPSSPACNASALEEACAGPEVNGIDISHYDGTIDWSTVKAHNVDFGIAKATEGTTFQDPTFAANWSGMKAAGVVRGAYQFFHPELDPTMQATYFADFVKASGGFQAGDIGPVADVEQTGSQTPATIQANLKTFLEAVKTATGMTPIVYVSPSFAQTNLGSGFGAYPLWIAQWNQGAACPTLPAGWTTWTFWQTYDKGTVQGVPGMMNVDLDVFDGTLAQLGGGGPTDAGTGAKDSGGTPKDAGTPPPPPPPPPPVDAGDGKPSAGGGDAGLPAPPSCR